jgi:antitoxin (DNA-binding transcriptional repressor) of toxin-antitoxin stability system
MKRVSKGVLKAKMLEFFRQVEETGEEIIVTDNNIPTLKVIPLKSKKRVEEIFGSWRGNVTIDDSILKPETDEWVV